MVRQNSRDAHEDHRSILYGFQYGNIPSVNTLESLYNFQVLHIMYTLMFFNKQKEISFNRCICGLVDYLQTKSNKTLQVFIPSSICLHKMLQIEWKNVNIYCFFKMWMVEYFSVIHLLWNFFWAMMNFTAVYLYIATNAFLQ